MAARDDDGPDRMPIPGFVEDELLRRYRRDRSEFLIGEEGASQALYDALFHDKDWY